MSPSGSISGHRPAGQGVPTGVQACVPKTAMEPSSQAAGSQFEKSIPSASWGGKGSVGALGAAGVSGGVGAAGAAIDGPELFVLSGWLESVGVSLSGSVGGWVESAEHDIARVTSRSAVGLFM